MGSWEIKCAIHSVVIKMTGKKNCLYFSLQLNVNTTLSCVYAERKRKQTLRKSDVALKMAFIPILKLNLAWPEQ